MDQRVSDLFSHPDGQLSGLRRQQLSSVRGQHHRQVYLITDGIFWFLSFPHNCSASLKISNSVFHASSYSLDVIVILSIEKYVRAG